MGLVQHVTWDSTSDWAEVAGYADVDLGDQLYHVLHKARGTAKGSVLLAGPFASMRRYVYTPWVRWARYLAFAGYDVLRFDYRGVGESTGDFSSLSMTDWLEDLQSCAQMLRRRNGKSPLILHGLHLGGLLACRAFREGLGSALLLWSTPATGKEMLEHALKMHRAARFRLLRLGSATPDEDHIALLESGQTTEVEGYRWSPRLWEEAESYRGVSELEGLSDKRPWVQASLDESAGPLQLSLRAAPDRDVGLPLNPNLRPLFRQSLKLMDRLRRQGSCGHAGSDAH